MINLAFSLIRKIYHSLHSSRSCQCSIEVCQVENDRKLVTMGLCCSSEFAVFLVNLKVYKFCQLLARKSQDITTPPKAGEPAPNPQNPVPYAVTTDEPQGHVGS